MHRKIKISREQRVLSIYVRFMFAKLVNIPGCFYGLCVFKHYNIVRWLINKLITRGHHLSYIQYITVYLDMSTYELFFEICPEVVPDLSRSSASKKLVTIPACIPT